MTNTMSDIDRKRIRRKISFPKVQILDILIVKCCEILKKQLLPVFSNLFQITKNLPIYFMKLVWLWSNSMCFFFFLNVNTFT